MSVTTKHRLARRSMSALGILLALTLVVPSSVAAQRPSAPHVPPNVTMGSGSGERLIVTYRKGTTDSARRGVRVGANSRLVRTLDLIHAEVVKPVGTSLAAAMAELRRDPRVAAVQVDHKLALDGDPTEEPDFTYQWALENTGEWIFNGVTSVPDVDADAATAWQTATGAGVTVAVLDSGVDFSHPDLVGQAWVNPGESGNGRETNGLDDDGDHYIDDVNGANVCGDAADNVLYVPGSDAVKHGTAVASVIAAAANGVGMTGIAPGARIMGVRFLIPNVCDSDSDAIRAIDYAIGSGAKIINASWGGSVNSPALQAAVDAANAAGILFVAAAGNVPTSLKHYPAAIELPNVLSVGAVQADGNPSSFTTYGSWVDMAAPGSAIYAAIASPTDEPYGFWDGTSFSAPLVSGAAALLAEADPTFLGDPSRLRRKLIDSGWRGNAAVKAKTGSGRVLDVATGLDFTPPVQPPPVTATPRVDTTLGTSSAITHLVWPFATDENGIDSYRVRYRPASSATWTWATTGTTNRYVDPTLSISVSYIVEIRARDGGGNESVLTFPMKLVRSQENVAAVIYTGTWKSSSSTSASSGATKYATSAGASATFSFTGKGVSVIAPRSTTRGSAKVYVDGVYVKTVSTYSSSAQSRRVVFSQAWATSAAHKVKLVVVGTSGHPRVDLDAFVVTQ